MLLCSIELDRMLAKNGVFIQLLGWTFNWKYMVRGLVVDKKRGNILKVLINNFSLAVFYLKEHLCGKIF